MKFPSHLAFLAGVCYFALPLHAEPQTTTVRIIGISEPARLEDFRKAVNTVPGLELVSVDTEKASAVLRFELPAVITKPKPRPEDVTPQKVLEQLDNLIGKASIRTFSLTAPTGTSEAALTKVDFHVGVLDCKGCRYGAYIAIAKLDGVERASVESSTRMLTAWIDPSKTTKETLEAALKKARVELF
jgi:hypothetical protein